MQPRSHRSVVSLVSFLSAYIYIPYLTFSSLLIFSFRLFFIHLENIWTREVRPLDPERILKEKVTRKRARLPSESQRQERISDETSEEKNQATGIGALCFRPRCAVCIVSTVRARSGSNRDWKSRLGNAVSRSPRFPTIARKDRPEVSSPGEKRRSDSRDNLRPWVFSRRSLPSLPSPSPFPSFRPQSGAITWGKRSSWPHGEIT